MLVSAIVGGSSFNEVTFYAEVGNDKWKSIGTDDTRPYRVFHNVSSIPDGKHVIYRAVVRDNAGHQRLSSPRKAVVPALKLTIELPAEGADVFGTIEVRATADPERASHVVRIQRRLPSDSDWVTVKRDDSSPIYSYYDDLSTVPVGTVIRYRAVLNEPDGTQVISPVRSVSRMAPQPLVGSVTVAGLFSPRSAVLTIGIQPARTVISPSTRPMGCGKAPSSSLRVSTSTRWPSTIRGMPITAQAERPAAPTFRSAFRKAPRVSRSSGIRCRMS
jgi:hypothetical protein